MGARTFWKKPIKEGLVEVEYVVYAKSRVKEVLNLYRDYTPHVTEAELCDSTVKTKDGTRKEVTMKHFIREPDGEVYQMDLDELRRFYVDPINYVEFMDRKHFKVTNEMREKAEQYRSEGR